MDAKNNFVKIFRETSTTGWLFMLLIAVVVTAISLALLSEVKCHYSLQSGGHCHSLDEAPHIHPFADH